MDDHPENSPHHFELLDDRDLGINLAIDRGAIGMIVAKLKQSPVQPRSNPYGSPTTPI
jgi:hypothetical protein